MGKNKLPKNEALILSRARNGQIFYAVMSPRVVDEKSLEQIVTLFLKFADRVRCTKCGYTYDGTRDFIVYYDNSEGLMSRVDAAACGKCVKEVSVLARLTEEAYARGVFQ